MVRLIHVCLSLMLAATLSACALGQDFSRVPATRTPYGPLAQVSVDKVVGGKKTGEYLVYDGEVFEVRSDGLVLLHKAGRLIFFSWEVARIEVPSLGISTNRETPALKESELMRLTSRHPYGLGPEQLKIVLAAFGQTAIEEVRR